ncbi:MAG: hypothetical protein IIC13_07165 [SAR324 cluster bacterium]|nr:hypothetical protein [SAR324 cluster bacterium]MCH8886353.1 hypothetical protein [SAR324 cluster bacterium]
MAKDKNYLPHVSRYIHGKIALNMTAAPEKPAARKSYCLKNIVLEKHRGREYPAVNPAFQRYGDRQGQSGYIEHH